MVYMKKKCKAGMYWSGRDGILTLLVVTCSFTGSLNEFSHSNFCKSAFPKAHSSTIGCLHLAHPWFSKNWLDLKKKNLFLYIWLLVISNHYLFAQLLVSAWVLSVQQCMTGNLKMLVTCLPCDSCLPVACLCPSKPPCMSVCIHPPINFFLLSSLS